MHEIDATNQTLGRLASRIAILLRGKLNPSYQPNLVPTEKVKVTNATKLRFSGAKNLNKVYYHYSGYPGGMKDKKIKEKMERDPRKVLRLAVLRMLAPNRLRAKMMNNLTIEK